MKEMSLEILCDLDAEELAQRSQQLSITVLKILEVESQKKSAMAEFKKELEALHKQQWSLSCTVRDRTEMRAVLCRVEFHKPSRDMKRISIKDTGEHFRDEPMGLTERDAHEYLEEAAAEEATQEQLIQQVVEEVIEQAPQYRPEPGQE